MDDNKTTPQLTVEERLARLEKWANTPSWLDQPSIAFDGEPIYMGDTWPLHIKIMGAIFVAAGTLVFGLLIYAGITGYKV